MTIEPELAASVGSRHALAAFVRALLRDMRESPDTNENRDLGSYLEAMAAWIEDMDGYYADRGEPLPEQPSWRTVAEILAAAAVYE